MFSNVSLRAFTKTQQRRVLPLKGMAGKSSLDDVPESKRNGDRLR
jgi:hypothetical protein